MTEELPEFESFASITRLTRPVIVTEKIDGCNAQVFITDDGKIHAGSRNRWLSIGKTTDQFGFAGWVKEHEQELIAGLGPGRHYGEWWGAGIQRKYGLKEKRFSLFNVSRWEDGAKDGSGNLLTPRPACCNVVPVLYEGPFDTGAVDVVLAGLADGGSVAAPGFMQPEGVVVFHVPSGTLFKKTLGGDGHKGQGERAAAQGGARGKPAGPAGAGHGPRGGHDRVAPVVDRPRQGPAGRRVAGRAPREPRHPARHERRQDPVQLQRVQRVQTSVKQETR